MDGIPTRTLTNMPTDNPWPHWDDRELLRLMDVALIDIEDRQPIPTDVLDALPPWRAVLVANVSELAGVPGAEYTVTQMKATALRVGGGAGPGWLTGRNHNTCHKCGRTSWLPDVATHQGWCPHWRAA